MRAAGNLHENGFDLFVYFTLRAILFWKKNRKFQMKKKLKIFFFNFKNWKKFKKNKLKFNKNLKKL